MTPPLSLALPLIEGETPSSFGSRIAARHETVPRELCSDLGMRWPYLCSGRPYQLERLAWLTGADISSLLRYCPQKIGIGRYKIGNTVSSTGAFRRTQVRICPQCAVSAFERLGRAGVYQLMEWSVTCIHLCQTHNVPLITLPREKTSHETYDVVSVVMRNWSEIAEAAQRGKAGSWTAFERNVRARVLQGPKEDWLADLELTHFHRACLSLGAARRRTLSTRCVAYEGDEERALCEEGFEILSQGPSRLVAELEGFKATYRSERPYYSADMGAFYLWLRTACRSEDLGQLSDVVRNYIFEAYPVKREKLVLGRSPNKVTLVSMEDARQQSGFGTAFLKRLICHLNDWDCERADELTDISLSDLKRAQEYWRSLVNLKQAAKMLGIISDQVKALVRLGVFEKVQFGSSLRYLKKEQIERCLASIDQLPVLTRQGNYLTLKHFCRLKGVPLAKVVSEWRKGRLEGLLAKIDGVGLRQIVIDQNAMSGKQSIQLNRDLTLQETATYLQISVISLRKVRDAGMLSQFRKRNPDTNFERNYICKKSIEQFETQYMTLGQISQLAGVAPIHMARRLDRDEVIPVDKFGSLVRVYERAQLPNELSDP